MDHKVIDPQGRVFTEHRWAGSCLEQAVRKFNPQAEFMKPRERRKVWLGMKDRGYRIVRPTDSAALALPQRSDES